MAHIERITDVPQAAVAMIRQRLEQRGATVTVTPQGEGLFTVEGLYPDAAQAEAALGAPGLASALAATAPGAPGAAASAGAAKAAPGAPVAVAAVASAAVPAAASATPPPLTDTQARTAKAIVNIFETGEVLGDYGEVTLIDGDTGHLTYGRSQTTLGSGLLHDLLAQYAGNAGARFGPRLRPYLTRLAARDTALDQDETLHNLLRAAADDPLMRDTQDQFFDLAYWRPALQRARAHGLGLPLSVAVVYDSVVHGSWATLRDATDAAAGTPQVLGERAWVKAYLARRRRWLATHERADLRPTVYRMDAFQRLADQGRWGLALPLVVRGCEISTLSLAGRPPHSYDGPTPGTRALAVTTPMARGLDVRLLQLALSDAGLPLKADGIFGQACTDGLRQWQAQQQLPASGVADPALVAQLAAQVFQA